MTGASGPGLSTQPLAEGLEVVTPHHLGGEAVEAELPTCMVGKVPDGGRETLDYG